MKALDAQPRAEVTSKRLAVSKLQKDFDRVKALVESIVVDASLIKADASLTSTASSSASSAASSTTFINAGGGNGQLQQGQLVALREVDIDALIVEERERDIVKLNQDIRLVNEMFK